MITTVDIDALTEKYICADCIAEDFLSRLIRNEGRRRKCSYCKKLGRSIPLLELAGNIQRVFEQFYERTADGPDEYQSARHADPESTYSWTREGHSVVSIIVDEAEIPREAAKDIQQILEDKFSNYGADQIGEETEYAESTRYEEKGVDSKAWEDDWHTFENTLKTETRYFNSSGKGQLRRIFSHIDELGTSTIHPILSAGPGQKLKVLYRARAFQSEISLEKALEDIVNQLGPPPYKQARAGRMNPEGVSVFYGATDIETALSEVRPPVGSKVAVAKFKITRKLRLLNLPALKEIRPTGSVFDENYADVLSRVKFISQLCDKMAAPVMPDDEKLEYLITQVIADYLSMNKALNLDGIVFPSIQTGSKGSNVVLFHKSSKVAERSLPPGTKSTVYLETYDVTKPDYFYTVVDEIIPKVKPKARKKKAVYTAVPLEPQDKRSPSLSIDDRGITINCVRRVKFTNDPHEVSFRQYKEYDFDEDPHDIPG